MANPASWIPPATLYPLGWALIHFLWQGAALAAFAAAAMALCRPSSLRYLIGVAFLVLMLAAPLITFFFVGPAPDFFLSLRDAVKAPQLLSRLVPWIVDGWVMGVALLSLRFGGSFAVLGWRTKHQTHDASPHLLALCGQVERRLGMYRVIRYLECHWLEAPAGLGALRPVILFPAAALTGLSEDQLRAVIAHELAHIRRWDFAVNLFQVMTETLLFYHPAIWWLNRRIRADREICCDEIAMAAYGNRVEYARALALLAEWKHVPALAMAASHGLLADRVLRLLRADARQARVLFAPLAASLMLLIVSLAAGNALVDAMAPKVLPVAVRAAVFSETIPLPAIGFPAQAAFRKIPAMRKAAHVAASDVMPAAFSSASLPALSFPLLPAAKESGADEAPVPGMQPVSLTQPDAPAQADETYPAPVLPLVASYGAYEWEYAQVITYCDQFAQQTVLQGASKPLLVDDAAKQRYGFFYWRCMMRNGQMQPDPGARAPAYSWLGAAAAGHPASVAGSWAITFPPFPASRSCTFTQSGNVLGGACTRSEGSGTVQGVVDGRQLRWIWSYLDDQKLPAEIDFIGMIGSDGGISGQYIQKKNGQVVAIQPFTARPGALSAQVASQDAAALLPAAPAATEPKPIAETHTLPHYRGLSLRLREEGNTLMQVALDPTGKPTDISVCNSCGSPRLDAAATQYVKEHWRWKPATRGGRAVAATVLVDVVWDIKG